MTLDFDRFDALTFDCYGTLIDWEAGLLGAFAPVLAAHGVTIDDEDLLGPLRRARGAPRGRPVPALPGRAGRRAARRGGGARVRARPSDEAAAFGGSVVDWPAFPDSAAALARLADTLPAGRPDQLRRRPVRGLQRTARGRRSTGSSRPSRSARTSRPRRTSSACSRASTCRATGSCTSPRACSTTTRRPSGSGMTTVWIDRRHDRPGAGATPPAEARPGCDLPGHGVVRRGRRPGLTSVRVLTWRCR